MDWIVKFILILILLQARLEERIQTCTQELARLKDPNNPNSNVNMKKIVLNDRWMALSNIHEVKT